MAADHQGVGDQGRVNSCAGGWAAPNEVSARTNSASGNRCCRAPRIAHGVGASLSGAAGAHHRWTNGGGRPTFLRWPLRRKPPTVPYELTARNLYTYYMADIHAYVMVMQN